MVAEALETSGEVVSSEKPQDEATALRDYGMAIAEAVAVDVADQFGGSLNDLLIDGDFSLAAIVASVKPPEQRYPPIANDQDKRLMLETLEFALRVPGGPEKMYADLRAELEAKP